MNRTLALFTLLPALALAENPWEIDIPKDVGEAMNACVRLDKEGAFSCEIQYFKDERVWAVIVGPGTTVDWNAAFWAGKKVALQLCRTRDTIYMVATGPRDSLRFGCITGENEFYVMD